MWVLVGLGNPGPQYETTRHNAGFLFLDLLKDHVSKDTAWRDQKVFECELASLSWKGNPLLLVKPLTFMNLSGRAVQKVLHYYKVPVSRMVAIYDDVDCAPGDVKMRMDGGHGGHNGVRSLIESLGSKEFPRIKLGVGKSGDTANWVLSRFTDDELITLQTKMFQEGLARLETLVLT